MNWDAIGAIGQMLGSVAVLATLVYLGREVRLSGAALERDARARTQGVRDSIRNTWQNFGLLIAGDNETAEIWVRGGRGDELDDIERERYDWLATELFHLEAQAYQNSVLYSNDVGSGDYFVKQAADFVKRYPGLRPRFAQRLATLGNSPFANRIKEVAPELMSA